MNGAKNILTNNLSGKKVLILFIVTNMVYALMLTVTIPKTMAFSGGMTLLDTMPMGYSPEYIQSLLSALGKMGREAYLFNQIPLDMIYPALFGTTYCLLLAYFLKKMNKFNSVYSYLCLLPIIAGIADYLENFGIITMLSSYPDLSEISMRATSIFSIFKSMAIMVYFIALSTTLIILGIRTLLGRSTNVDKP